MKTTGFIGLLLSLLMVFCPGCVTYHKDLSVILVTEPPGAEVWKDTYFMGITPYLLRFTATWEDKERGNVSLPPLRFKKEGYREKEVKLEIELTAGERWECWVELEPAVEE